MSRTGGREPGRVWVSPPAPELECSVCTEVFHDPVTLACGHTFCRACTTRWFTTAAKRCPTARCPASANSQPAALPTNYALKSIAEALLVHCRFGTREGERGEWLADPEGCPAQLSRAEAESHETTCEYVVEVCPFAGCGVERRRRDADAHNVAAAAAHARGMRNAHVAPPQAVAKAVLAFQSALPKRRLIGVTGGVKRVFGVRGQRVSTSRALTLCFATAVLEQRS